MVLRYSQVWINKWKCRFYLMSSPGNACRFRSHQVIVGVNRELVNGSEVFIGVDTFPGEHIV